MPGSPKAVAKLINVLSTWLPSLRSRFVLLVAGLFLVLSVVMIMVASYLDLRDEEHRVVSDAQAIGATVSRLAVPHLTNHHYLILEQELESIASSGVVELARCTIRPGRSPSTAIRPPAISTTWRCIRSSQRRSKPARTSCARRANAWRLRCLYATWPPIRYWALPLSR
ncbi:hypothetical protein [Roseibium sediminicola]|uniref:Uncharacterized protein n=1 Tax=Roseibium sediminicola TaxID=2933272 RepID=A0ABT0GMF3_9HYPH|nr:hypothetical protein [Roseibium sp. CAU 1639]MCK7610597.1 hypothetical protein [Roseibium sp. CAU 1639]